jgi:hypothetical protein
MLAVVRLGAVHSLVFGGININRETGVLFCFFGGGEETWACLSKIG